MQKKEFKRQRELTKICYEMSQKQSIMRQYILALAGQMQVKRIKKKAHNWAEVKHANKPEQNSTFMAKLLSLVIEYIKMI